MTISVTCPRCASNLKAKESLAGKRIACPKCKEPIQIPIWDDVIAPEFAEPLVLDDSNNSNGMSEPDFSFPSHSSQPKMSDLLDKHDSSHFEIHTSNQTPTPASSSHSASSALPPDDIPSQTYANPLPLIIGVSAIVLVLLVGTIATLAWVLSSATPNTLVAQNQTAEQPQPTPTNDAADSPPASSLTTTPAQASSPSAPAKSTPTKTTPLKSNPAAPSASVEPPPKNAIPQNTPPQPSIDLGLETQFAACTVIEVSKASQLQRCLGLLVIKSELNGSQNGFVVTSSNLFTSATDKAQAIHCTFKAGTRHEVRTTAKLEIIDEELNLAILRVTDKSLPQAFSFNHSIELQREAKLISFGIANSKASPTTPLRSLISKTEHDYIHSIDGLPEASYLSRITSTNQTNTIGSPIFDSSGRLAGMFVSTDPENDQFAFAISSECIANAVLGRVAKAERRFEANNSGSRTISVELDLFDPTDNITQVDVQIYPFPANSNTNKVLLYVSPNEKASATIPCKISGKTAVASIPWDKKPGAFYLRYRVRGQNRYVWNSPPFLLTDEMQTSDGMVRNHSSKSNRRNLFQPSASTLTNAAPLKLRTAMADFAFNPNNGDIAAVDPMGNQVTLFRTPYPTDGSPTQSIPVGNKPSAIAYKKFGSTEYYAVICNDNKSLVLIDANNFTIQKETPFTTRPGYSIWINDDEKDPFLLISNGTITDSESIHTNSIDLVDLRNDPAPKRIFEHGIVFLNYTPNLPIYTPLTQTSYFPLNPLACSRSTKSTSYFGILDSPYHSFATSFTVDPHGLYIANKNNILTRDLQQIVGFVDFVPMCFLKERAWMVGLDGTTLRAASYNTFRSAKGAVSVPLTIPAIKEVHQAYRSNSFTIANWFLYHTRMFADEKRSRIIVASQDTLYTIPLASLGLEDEPFLIAKANTSEINVGEKSTITLSPQSDKVEVKYADLPDGATVSNQNIEWQPTLAQVGPHVLSAALKYGNIEREIKHSIVVGHPRLELSGDLAASVYNAQENFIVSPPSKVWYQAEDLTEEELRKAEEGSLVSVHSLKPGDSKRLIPDTRNTFRVFLIGSQIVVFQMVEGNGTLEFFDYPSLKKGKTIPTTGAVMDLKMEGGKLMVVKFKTLEVYDPETLKLRHTIKLEHPLIRNSAYLWNPANSSIVVPKDGVLNDGMLLNPSTKEPKLCLSIKIPDVLSVIPRVTAPQLDRVLRVEKPRSLNEQNEVPKQAQGEKAPIPNSDWFFHWEKEELPVFENKSDDPIAAEIQLFLVFSSPKSEITKRVWLARSKASQVPQLPTFKLTSNALLVQWERITHFISLDFIEESSAKEQQNLDEEEFYFEPKQSHFMLAGGKNSLKHKLIGGKAPIEFSAVIEFPGLQINKQSGSVLIDMDTIARENRFLVLKTDPPAKTLRFKNADEVIRAWTAPRDKLNDLLQIKLRGAPLAIPIHIRATDADDRTTELFYYVIGDVNSRQISKLMELMDK